MSMITFSQFLQQYHEIITIDNPEAESTISISQRGTETIANFTVDDIEFECALDQQRLHYELASYNGKIIQKYIELGLSTTGSYDNYPPNMPPFQYEITLQNKSTYLSFDLKNLYGFKAIKIYNYMVLAIKKIIHELESKGNPVNIISYSAFDTSTEPLYDKLFKQFLGDKYIRVSRNSVMKKEIFDIVAHQNDEIKNYQQEVQTKHQEKIQAAKQTQSDKREMRKLGAEPVPKT